METTTTSEEAIENEVPKLNYSAHVSNIGWQSMANNGEIAGTTGKNLEIEALKFSLNSKKIEGHIEARVHVRNLGWLNWEDGDKVIGTTGRALPIEAIQLKLIGKLAETYDIYYRVHVQNFGWLDWTLNGKSAGSEGFAYHVEAIEVKLIKRGRKLLLI